MHVRKRVAGSAVLWLAICCSHAAAVFMPEYTNACHWASNPSNLPIAQTLAWIWTTNQAPNPALEWTNARVKIVTWTRFSNSFAPYVGTGQLVSNYWDTMWVSVAPQLYDFFADTNRYPVPIDVVDAKLRIEQLLGVYNDSLNVAFAEVWARPEDLYRPSRDAGITTASTGIDWPVPLQTPPGFASAEAYVAWFTNRAATIYTADFPFPWTQLGYTYDWCPASTTVIGISEYVLKKNAEYYVASVCNTLDYIPTSPEPGSMAGIAFVAWLCVRRGAAMRKNA